MMAELVLTRGLPASGKSTWARAWVAEDPSSRVRVNRDDLRMNLFGLPFLDWKGEEAVSAAQQGAVASLLAAGRSVVVDDTNLRLKYARAWLDLAVKHGASWTVRDFLDVPVDECVRRDAARDKPVGAGVINGMYARYLAAGPLADVAPLPARSVAVKPYDPPLLAPKAWIVDIDGTLALMGDRRGPFDWDDVYKDEPNVPVVEMVKALALHTPIILMSGRDSVCRGATEQWLQRFGIPYAALHMRAAGDQRKDAIVKAELFDVYVRANFNVQGVIDDRRQVVDMWRSMGLVCAQVAEGDF